MKRLHRQDAYGWSQFDEARNIDFHSFLWVRGGGNIAVDPLPPSPHDMAHLEELGGIETIVLTTSDHVRAAASLRERFGARVLGPCAEKEDFPIPCDGWLGEGDVVGDGIAVFELAGSKTPGELALVLDRTTLVCGDLVRCHLAGELCLLPDAKLADKKAAVESVRRLATLDAIECVWVADGWPVFRDGHRALCELAAKLA